MRRGRVYSIEEYTWEVENSGDRIIGVMEAEVKTVEALKDKFSDRSKQNEIDNLSLNVPSCSKG